MPANINNNYHFVIYCHLTLMRSAVTAPILLASTNATPLLIALCATVLLTIAAPSLAQSSLPDPQLTPGAINPAVTQDNIDQTICVRGWTRAVRPPEAYTHQLKRWSIEQYGYTDYRLNQYQFDHLVPLEIGGAPADPTNLWPEPIIAADGWRADDKDLLERTLNHLVCSHRSHWSLLNRPSPSTGKCLNDLRHGRVITLKPPTPFQDPK